MKYLIVLLLLTGCGIDVHGHVDDVKIEPVTVTHTFDINFQAVVEYCNKKCDAQSTDPATQKTCSADCYANFISILAAAVAGPTPTPSPTP